MQDLFTPYIHVVNLDFHDLSSVALLASAIYSYLSRLQQVYQGNDFFSYSKSITYLLL